MEVRQSTYCREQMKEDLMKVFREVCSSYECKNNREAWRQVVTHEAPRFYIDSRRAHLYISPMLRGDTSKIDKLSPLKREMYQELFKTVMRIWQEDKYYGKSLNYVLQFAILEPAPRFYIDTKRMEQIWKEKRRKKRHE